MNVVSRERIGITYVYFYTTFDERTTKRRAGSPAARSSSEFSTALAGGRGAASASTASRSQAPREGSSAPPVWSRCSSACPTRARGAQRRSLRTVAASRGASWFGSRSVACEGGIELLVRARGVGRSSGRAHERMSPWPRAPQPCSTFCFHGLVCLRWASSAGHELEAQRVGIELASEASRMFVDAGAVRFAALRNSEHTNRPLKLLVRSPADNVPARVNHRGEGCWGA